MAFPGLYTSIDLIQNQNIVYLLYDLELIVAKWTRCLCVLTIIIIIGTLLRRGSGGCLCLEHYEVVVHVCGAVQTPSPKVTLS